MSEKKKALTIPSTVNTKLSTNSTKRFRESLSKQHEGLTPAQVKLMSDGLLNRMSDYMEKGYTPAMAKPKPDGTMDIVVLYFEQSDDETKTKKRKS
jgi:hypothetical protein